MIKAPKANDARQQAQDASAKLRMFGGMIEYDYEYDSWYALSLGSRQRGLKRLVRLRILT